MWVDLYSEEVRMIDWLVGALRWVSRRDLARRRVPIRQIKFLLALERTVDVLRSRGWEPLLVRGTLLGAVRSGGFAGRPQDLDLALHLDTRNQITDVMAALRHHTLLVSKHDGDFFKLKSVRRLLRLRIEQVPISLYLLFVEAGRMECRGSAGDLLLYLDELPIDSVECFSSVFENLYRVPKKAHGALVRWYGSTWKNPDPLWTSVVP